jgi:Ca-activated chloride channel homolog
MRASGVLLLAAAQLCGVLFMSAPALAANASNTWSSLWRTPDQEGQALLDAGQPAQAAQHFQDPRRRAYADLQSGGYSGAAKLLAPFTDARSEYNRGNALAKSGQLQAALAAYDSALKQAPADKDVRHNRDLVERALQRQEQHQQSPQSSSQHGRQGSQGSQGQGGQGGTSQGQRPQSSANGKQGSSGSQQSGSASQQSQDGGSQSTHSSPQAGANANQPGNSSQAQREAADAAALARAQRQRGAATNAAQRGRGSEQNGKAPGTDDNLLAGGSQTPKQKPETERQMALDQWLRQIPDSPAGLLRRKFLIEHMIRQQDSGGSPDSAQ